MQDLLEELVVWESAHKYFYLRYGYASLQFSQLRVLDYFEKEPILVQLDSCYEKIWLFFFASNQNFLVSHWTYKHI